LLVKFDGGGSWNYNPGAMSVVQYIDRNVQLPADASTTDACVNGPHDGWQMLDSERAALGAIVNWLRPQGGESSRACRAR
jgi:hypothetical protein